MASNEPHPFYPKELYLPHYKENTKSIEYILGVTLGTFTAIYVVAWLMLKKDRYGRVLSVREKATLCWFGMSGCIHTVLEGYLSLTSATLAGSDHILAQIWKEYGKGDSRYISNDTCMIVMESITAWLEGPGCFLIVWAFFTRHPMRYVIQLAVSIGQFYGVLLYFIAEFSEGFSHGPLYHPIYFWLYVVGFNSPWVIVPPIMIRQAWKELSKAQGALDKSNGFAPSVQSKKRK